MKKAFSVKIVFPCVLAQHEYCDKITIFGLWFSENVDFNLVKIFTNLWDTPYVVQKEHGVYI